MKRALKLVLAGVGVIGAISVIDDARSWAALIEGLGAWNVVPWLLILVPAVLWLAGDGPGVFTKREHGLGIARFSKGGTAPAAPEATPARVQDLPGAPRRWMPRGDGKLFGRADAVADVVSRLERADLVTLLGPGGAGKTRLAIAVGERLRKDFGDRVSFVDLLRIESGESVLGALARQLDIRLVPRVDDLETVRLALDRDEMLLIVDNCEHVLGEAAELIAELLDTCSKLKVLATSRVALGISHETRYEVAPLVAPPEDADLLTAGKSPAVQLFVERAKRVATFELDDATTPGVVSICRAVDGLPYALVLIAARLGTQHLNDVVGGVADSLLTFAAGGRPGHRETLAKTIAWSVELLPRDEQLLFRRISVFTGSFTVPGAQAVAPELATDRVRDGLANLCAASLIHKVPDEELTRYRLLEVARAWGRQALEEAETAELHTTQRAHAEHVTTVVRDIAPQLLSRDRLRVLQRLDAEYDDVVAALSWCTAHAPDLGRRLAGTMWWYWNFRGLLQEGTRRLDAALAGPPGRDALARAEVLLGSGNLAYIRGDFDVALERLDETVRTCDALEAQGGADATEAKRLRGYALMFVGMSQSSIGHGKAAHEAVRASTKLFRSTADKWGLALALNYTGTALRYTKDTDEAQAAYQESLALWEELGDPWGLSLTLSNLAIVAIAQDRAADASDLVTRAQPLLAGDGAGGALAELILAEVARLTGDVASAQAHYRESLRQNRAIDRPTAVAECLDRYGLFAAKQGAIEAAALAFGAADAYRQANGMVMTGAAFPTGPRDRERERLTALGGPALADAAFARTIARGRELAPEEALDRAELRRPLSATPSP